jgi:hypothetical protein
LIKASPRNPGDKNVWKNNNNKKKKKKKKKNSLTNFAAVAMETKKGGFKKQLDSFAQTS